MSGVDLIVTFRIGEWTKLWFDESVTEEQVSATQELFRNTGSFLYGELLLAERVPLSIERTEDQIVYTSPETRTEITVVRGLDDEPVKILNLRSFRDYVQYRSELVIHEARGDGRSFTHQGTNGFAANYRAKSE